MNCPKCGLTLVRKPDQELETCSCPACAGMWLSPGALKGLEDRVFDEEQWKGSLVHWNAPVAIHCPACGRPMEEFQYRIYSLKLAHCPSGHGFWLNAGEAEQILEIMGRRKADIRRKLQAEGEFHRMLERWKKNIFIRQIFRFFGM